MALAMSVVSWGRQKAMNLAGFGYAKANNLTARIDDSRTQQKQRRISRDEGVKVGHYAVLPNKCSYASIRPGRQPNYNAFVVNPPAGACNISRECAEVAHAFLSGPQKGVSPIEHGCVRRLR